MSTGMRNTGMWCWKGTRGENYTIDRDIRVNTWWHLSSSVELGFWESWESWWSSECNALGFDEFWGGTKCGGDEGGLKRFGTSQDLSAMSHECYGNITSCHQQTASTTELMVRAEVKIKLIMKLCGFRCSFVGTAMLLYPITLMWHCWQILASSNLFKPPSSPHT